MIEIKFTGDNADGILAEIAKFSATAGKVVNIKPATAGGGGQAAATDTTTTGVTVDQIRAMAAEKSSGGKAAEVKALVGEFGARKLSELKEKNYAGFYEKLKAL